ncbi:MAG: type III-A CRISPR-associated RAMP protein Csm3 [Lachnospiraceae bacterium]|nr:type III-A CRISPR-associated RAMP protein Csm3 [Lachnospiraceae bacterium]
MKLEQIIIFRGEIKCLTGLSIGGTSNSLEIGGIDREVIKHPITKEPYIPGSSLKGKMRSELEYKYGAFIKDKKTGEYLSSESSPCGCGRPTCAICRIFGAHKNPGADSAPTRIIVRDAILSQESRDKINNLPVDYGSYLERKTENIILRDSGIAGSPRTIERVPRDMIFDFEIILRIFEKNCIKDNEKELISMVKEGLKLVEKSYLGGCGSRGYGQVKIEVNSQESLYAGGDKSV